MVRDAGSRIVVQVTVAPAVSFRRSQSSDRDLTFLSFVLRLVTESGESRQPQQSLLMNSSPVPYPPRPDREVVRRAKDSIGSGAGRHLLEAGLKAFSFWEPLIIYSPTLAIWLKVRLLVPQRPICSRIETASNFVVIERPWLLPPSGNR